MSAAADGLQVDTPTNVVQCQTVVFTWRGDNGPYYPTIKCDDGLTTGSYNPQFQNSYTWNVDTIDDYPVNCTLSIRDALGNTASSRPFLVTPGPPDCILTLGTPTESPATTAQSPTSGSSQSSTTWASINSASNPPLFSSTSSKWTAPTPLLPPAPPDSPPSAQRHSSRATLYAGIFGGLGCLLAVLAACWYFLIGRKQGYQQRDRVSIENDYNPRDEGTMPGSGFATAGIKEPWIELSPSSFTDMQEWSPAALLVEEELIRREKFQIPWEVEVPTPAQEVAATPTSEEGMTPEQLAVFQSLISSNAPREAVASVIQMVTGGGVPGSSRGPPPPQYDERS